MRYDSSFLVERFLIFLVGEDLFDVNGPAVDFSLDLCAVLFWYAGVSINFTNINLDIQLYNQIILIVFKNGS
jgi:hypothetical protein